MSGDFVGEIFVRWVFASGGGIRAGLDFSLSGIFASGVNPFSGANLGVDFE